MAQKKGLEQLTNKNINTKTQVSIKPETTSVQTNTKKQNLPVASTSSSVTPSTTSSVQSSYTPSTKKDLSSYTPTKQPTQDTADRLYTKNAVQSLQPNVQDTKLTVPVRDLYSIANAMGDKLVNSSNNHVGNIMTQLMAGGAKEVADIAHMGSGLLDAGKTARDMQNEQRMNYYNSRGIEVEQVTPWKTGDEIRDNLVNYLSGVDEKGTQNADDLSRYAYQKYGQYETKLGQLADQVLVNTGQNLFRWGKRAALGLLGVPGLDMISDASMFLSSGGDALREAEAKGADPTTSMLFAIGTGLSNAGWEHLGGGVDPTRRDAGLDNLIGNVIKNSSLKPAVKFVAETIYSIGEEAFEEFATEITTEAARRATIGSDNTLGEVWHNAKQAFLMGAMGAVLLSPVGGKWNKNQYMEDLAVYYWTMPDTDKATVIDILARNFGKDPELLAKSIEDKTRGIIENMDADTLMRAINDAPVASDQNGNPVFEITKYNKDQRAAYKFAQNAGADLAIVESVQPFFKNGQWYSHEAFVDKANKKIIIDSNSQNTVQQAVGHEVGHLFAHTPEGRAYFQTAIDIKREMLGEQEFQNYINSLENEYGLVYDPNATNFDANIMEEVGTEFAEEMMKDPEVVARVLRRNGNLFQKMYQKIQDAIASYDDQSDLTAEQKKLLKAEKMYSDAVASLAKEAREDRRNGFLQKLNPVLPNYHKLSPTLSHSLKSMRIDMAEGTDSEMVQDLLRTGVFQTDEEATAFVNNVNELMNLLSQRAFLDMHEEADRDTRAFSPIKKNSDKLYEISLDYSTLCKKRIITQAIIEKLNVERGQALDAKTQFAITELLRQYQAEESKLQVACALCYVEAARLKSPKVINQFINNPAKYMTSYFVKQGGSEGKQIVADAQNNFKVMLGVDPSVTKQQMADDVAERMTVGEFNDILKSIGADELNGDPDAMMTPQKVKNAYNNYAVKLRESLTDTLTDDQKAAIELAKSLDRKYYLTADGLTDLKMGKVNGEYNPSATDIYNAFTNRVTTATRSKAIETDVAYYYGDAKAISDSLIERMNAENGLRTQSWSDFTMKHLLDEITSTAELATRNAKMHGYTKVPEYVLVKGKTGEMINNSLIPAGRTGFDEHGNLAFSPTEGMPIEESNRLREIFPDTDGSICIGINDDQIRALMKDDRIDYVIPYHVSGLTSHLRTIAGINKWANYTGVQNETAIPGRKQGAAIKFSDWYTDDIKNQNKSGLDIMMDAQQNYLDLCAERGYIPKFPQFLINNGDGTYSIDPENPNYWKLLIDRKMINQMTGNIIEQKAVRPDFNWEDTWVNGQRVPGLFSLVNEAEDPRTSELVEHMAGIVQKAMDDGTIGAIAENSPEVKRDMEYFIKNNPIEQLGEDDADEYEWNGDPYDPVTRVEADVQTEVAPPFYDLQTNVGYGNNGIAAALMHSLKPMANGSDNHESTKSILASGGDVTDNNPTEGGEYYAGYETRLDSGLDEMSNGSEGDRRRNSNGNRINSGEVGENSFGVTKEDNANKRRRVAGVIRSAVRDSSEGQQLVKHLGGYEAFAQRLIDDLAQGKSVDAFNPFVNGKINNVIDAIESEPSQFGGGSFVYDSGGRELSKSQAEFFKDSKARDKNGNLLELYHGSPNWDITVFDVGMAGNQTGAKWDRAIWFTPNYDFADIFSRTVSSNDTLGNAGGLAGEVYSVYLNMKKPVDMTNLQNEDRKLFYEGIRNQTGMTDDDADAFINGLLMEGDHQKLKKLLDYDLLQAQGYDGIIARMSRYDEEAGDDLEYGVFDSRQVKRTDNLNPTDNPDIRHSLKPIDWDELYFDALNRGDMDEAQRLRFAHASENGYTDRAYHGTQAFGFTEPDVSYSDDGKSFFVTDDRDVAKTYAGTDVVKPISGNNGTWLDNEIHNTEKQIDASVNDFIDALNQVAGNTNWHPDVSQLNSDLWTIASNYVDNTAVNANSSLSKDIDDELFHWIGKAWQEGNPGENNMMPWLMSSESDYVSEVEDKVIDRFGRFINLINGTDTNRGIYDLVINPDNLLEHDAKGKKWNDLDIINEQGGRTKETTRSLADYAQGEGYNGYVLNNVFDDGGFGATRQQNPATVYDLFDPGSQVKSADTITYDDNGNIIPLSQRDNPNVHDLRHSLKPMDTLDSANPYPDRNYPQDLSAMRTLGSIYRDQDRSIDPLSYEEVVPERMPEPAPRRSALDRFLDSLADEREANQDPMKGDGYQLMMEDEEDLSTDPDEEEVAMFQSFTPDNGGHGANRAGAIMGFKDLAKQLDYMLGKDTEQRAWARENLEKPHSEAQGRWMKGHGNAYESLHDICERLGIWEGTKESAATQWLGEGVKRENGEEKPYTLEDLKKEFPDKWQNIVELEQYTRQTYKDYISKVNAMRKEIYGDPNERHQKDVDKWEADIRSNKNLLNASTNANDIQMYTDIINDLQRKVDDTKKKIKNHDYEVGKFIIPRLDFFHHFRDAKDAGVGTLTNLLATIKANDNADAGRIDPQLVTISEYTKPKTRWQGALQRRGKGEYTADAVGGLRRYIDSMEYALAYDPLIAHNRDVVNRMIKATRQTKNANTLIDYLSEWTNSIAGKTSPFDRFIIKNIGNAGNRGAILNALEKINQRGKANAVVGNIRSALAQPFNIPNARSIIKSDSAWLKGIKDYYDAKLGNRELLDQSPFLAERYQDLNADDFKVRETILEKLGGKTNDIMSKMMEFGDREAAELIWLSAYNEAVEKGVDDKIFYADDMTRRSIGGRGVGETPYNMKSRLANFIMPFQLESNNQWQNLKHMVEDKDAAGVFRLMMATYLMNAIPRFLFNDNVLPDVLDALVQGIKKLFDKDREETVGEVLGETAQGIAGETVSMIPGASLWLPLLMGDNAETFFGDSSPTRYGTGAVGLKNVFDVLADAVNGDGFDAMTPLLQLGLPVGGKQASRFYNTLQDFNVVPSNGFMNTPIGGEKNPVNGDYTKKGALKYTLPEEVNSADDAMEIARAFLFGSNATNAAQEYYDTGKPALSAEKVAKLREDANLDPELYIQYLKEANADGSGGISQQEASEWISSHNLTKEEADALWNATNSNWKKSYEDYSSKDTGNKSGNDSSGNTSNNSVPKNKNELAKLADSNGNGTLTQAEAWEWLSKQDMPEAQKASIWRNCGWKTSYYDYKEKHS